MASALDGDSLDSPTDWEVLPDAAFDELVTSIIADPYAALLALETPLLKRERDGATLLLVFAGGEHCRDSCDELLVRLLYAGIPVDTGDMYGWTPLLEAAQEGQLRNCEVLLANGATPDLAANDGMTPLQAAASVGNAEMTKWLLKQPGTWSRRWDSALFGLLLDKTPTAALEYLDVFAEVQNHSKVGNAAVKYTDLRFIYGESFIPTEETALGLVVGCEHGKMVLPHRVMRHLLKVKWHAFGKSMFRREFAIYCSLVASYFFPTIWVDPIWVQLATKFDYWVAGCHAVSWVCSLYLLINVEYQEFTAGARGNTLGANARAYFTSFWNCLNFTSYTATMVSIPVEFIPSLAEERNCLLAVVTVTLWINMLQFLQVSKHSGLLLAMMSRMSKDIYRFCILYSVFLLGFSGAFYLLLRGSTGFESFRSAFIHVLLMLFGGLNYDTFRDTQGWTWYVSHMLLFAYLLGVVVVLLNILIAMMATTYSDISDAAEQETMLCHAQAILRMENSLRQRARQHTYDKLLGLEAVAVAGPNEISVEIPIAAEGTDKPQSLRARVSEKTSTLIEKMLGMVRTRAAPKTLPTWSAMVATQLNFKMEVKTRSKSTSEGGRQLGLLEDGVRYEVVRKTASDSKSQEELILELQSQLQQLTAFVKDLGNGGAGGSSAPGATPRRRKSLVRYASAVRPAELV